MLCPQCGHEVARLTYIHRVKTWSCSLCFNRFIPDNPQIRQKQFVHAAFGTYAISAGHRDDIKRRRAIPYWVPERKLTAKEAAGVNIKPCFGHRVESVTEPGHWRVGVDRRK